MYIYSKVIFENSIPPSRPKSHSGSTPGTHEGFSLRPIGAWRRSVPRSFRILMVVPQVSFWLMVVMMMVLLLLRCLRGIYGGCIAHHQFATASHALQARIHRLLSADRLMEFSIRGLMQILPCLSVIPVQSSSALRTRRIVRFHRIAVGRRPMQIMLRRTGTSISAKIDKKKFEKFGKF